jgi:hypothetical protein
VAREFPRTEAAPRSCTSGSKKSSRARDQRRESALQAAVETGHPGSQPNCQFNEQRIESGMTRGDRSRHGASPQFPNVYRFYRQRADTTDDSVYLLSRDSLKPHRFLDDIAELRLPMRRRCQVPLASEQANRSSLVPDSAKMAAATTSVSTTSLMPVPPLSLHGYRRASSSRQGAR